MKKTVSVLSCIILILTCIAVPKFGTVVSFGAFYGDINAESVFLKQHTSVTCTLSAAAMIMRRTAIIVGYDDWEEITEENIKDAGWVDGIGLLWNFKSYNMTMGHGYFSGSDNKQYMISLLSEYPQGIVIYNGGNSGQNHAVVLLDYDEEADIFYVADPSNQAAEGRITLMESTIVGSTQDEKIENLTSYWYIVSPKITLTNGEYLVSDDSGNSSTGSDGSSSYDPTSDTAVFNSTKTPIGAYYVVTDDTSTGAPARYYPSGSSSTAAYYEKGTIVFVMYSGQNNFGATWYKTGSGYYIYSGNLMSFAEYSAEVTKFNNTSKAENNTYTVSSESDTKAALRLEPAEGNNIIGYADNGTQLYITQTGVNTVSASWLLTEEGYYIKASEALLSAAGKTDGAGYAGSVLTVSGLYSVSPIEDASGSSEAVSQKYSVNANSGLNLRKSPVDGEIICVIPNNTVVTVTEILSGWGLTEYNGEFGWISLTYASVVSENTDPLEITTLRLADDTIETGSHISCLVTAEGGAGDYTVRLTLCNESGLPVGVYTAETESYLLYAQIDEAGVYYFYVEVTDADGDSVTAYSHNFTVYDLLQIDNVTSDIEEYCYVYDTIIWTVETSSYSDDALYNYIVYCDDEQVLVEESSEGTLSYVPENAGSYTVSVSLSNDYSDSKTIMSDKVAVYDRLTIDSIKLSSASVLNGESVECSIQVTGGTGDYRYCFSLFMDSEIIRTGTFDGSSVFEYTFTHTGSYRFFCTVTDSANMIISAFSSEINVYDRILGDVDGSGTVTVADARLALRYAARLETPDSESLAAGDVDGDGKISVADARLILRVGARLDSFS